MIVRNVHSPQRIGRLKKAWVALLRTQHMPQNRLVKNGFQTVELVSLFVVRDL